MFGGVGHICGGAHRAVDLAIILLKSYRTTGVFLVRYIVPKSVKPQPVGTLLLGQKLPPLPIEKCPQKPQ